jgi:SagB-type dehydrogenase family enzyme
VPCGAFAEASEVRIELPPAELVGTISVEESMQSRRSVREYARHGLSLDDVSQLAWSAQGITGRRGLRTAPSAGALYPLELYVVAGNVEGLADAVYRYEPKGHELIQVGTGDFRRELASAALGQDWVRAAPATFVFAGVFERTTKKYGERGRRYVHMEAGTAAQNLYLQAVARDLGTVVIGAFRDEEVRDVLGLPGDHAPLALMPVGRQRR